jgi:hypothetical protein
MLCAGGAEHHGGVRPCGGGVERRAAPGLQALWCVRRLSGGQNLRHWRIRRKPKVCIPLFIVYKVKHAFKMKNCVSMV